MLFDISLIFSFSVSSNKYNRITSQILPVTISCLLSESLDTLIRYFYRGMIFLVARIVLCNTIDIRNTQSNQYYKSGRYHFLFCLLSRY